MQEETVYQWAKSLEALLAQGGEDQVRQMCAEQRPADLAEALDFLDGEEKQAVFRLLDLPQAAEVLGECDEDQRAELMAALSEEILARVVDHLPPDDAADAVSELSDERAGRVLSKIRESEEIRDLLRYDEESAGGIMTPDVIAFPETMTVGELLDAFRGGWKTAKAARVPVIAAKPEWENAYELIREENIYSIFVVDNDRKLKGFVRLQDILRSDSETRLSEILDTDVISVLTGEDQEEVAELAQKYDLVSIPVTDSEGHLVGRITIDDVIDVIEEETTEDFMKMAGTTEDELITESALRSLGLRLPWIMVALLGLFLSATILRFFEPTIARVVQLMPFIPVVCGITGNTAVQSATIIIRGLATGQIDVMMVFSVIFKEIRTGILIGVVCGGVVLLVAYWFTQIGPVAWAVGISVFCAISVASSLGVFIPLFLARIGKDPAIATGPIVTSLSDATAGAIYFIVATAIV